MITAAAVAGALTHVSGGAVNVVNATRLAQSRGIRVNQMQQESPVPYTEVVEIRVASDAGTARVSGALLGDTHERIVQVDDYTVSVTPRGTLLVLRNADSPQVISLVGTVLARGPLCRRVPAGEAGWRRRCAFVDPDRPAAERRRAFKEFRSIPDVRQVQQVNL